MLINNVILYEFVTLFQPVVNECMAIVKCILYYVTCSYVGPQ